MFSLHETTQRRVCRVVFVVFAVAPMLLSLAWIAYSQRPWREADWRRTLSQQLHVRAAVEHIASPRPGVVRLKNVRLADLRSGLPFWSLGAIRAQWRGPLPPPRAGELPKGRACFPFPEPDTQQLIATRCLSGIWSDRSEREGRLEEEGVLVGNLGEAAQVRSGATVVAAHAARDR